MTSTTTGLPDRYRPLDQVGPDEPTPTGVIQCWRAKDRVLNRDVAIRVHTPAGPAAHAWISRALTAGGLATPALAMVYDASEGIGGGPGGETAPGGAAYVVNEWIDGETLAERLTRGPMPDREVRTVLRRLAEGVAEAHRVGLAVGGLTPDNVVLRPNGLVGLRAVPAATGTIDGDITALGALLEACLTGLDPAEPGPRRLSGPSDLVALVRRTRSTEPGQGLSSVAAMASLLAERSRPGPMSAAARAEETDSGWLRRLRDRRPDQPSDHPVDGATRAADGVPVRLDPQTLPPVPPVRPVTSGGVPPAALGGDTIAAGSVAPAGGAYAGSAVPTPPARYDDEPFGVLDDDAYEEPATGTTDIDEDGARRHRLVVVGLPLLALLVVAALAWWFGKGVISVAGDVD
jgi:eukaryotic-like serine/threonine-protein kinase